MNVYIAERNEIHPEAIGLLKKKGFRFLSSDKIHKAEILFIRTLTKADKNYLSKFPSLKYLLRAGVGLDNVDLEECKKRNIKVINSPASNADSVAEHVILLSLLVLKNTLLQIDLIKSGGWRKKELIGSDLKNKVIGIVGCGAIGKLVAKKIRSFDVKEILGFDPYLDKSTLLQNNIKKVSLKKLLTNSDIVTMHLPLTPETKNLISSKELKMMKKSAYLINTARGGIVNENDLITALKQNIIKGAAFDVFENEPHINVNFLNLPNLVITPHISAFTKEADLKMSVLPVLTLLKEVGLNC